MSNARGLYIHIPFCVRKCPYCDFYSAAGSEELYSAYAEAVIRNLRRYDEEFDTVYFGGGTPNLLADKLGGILNAASIAKNAEISAECNPCTADDKTLYAMREAGINRLSFGVQSMSDRELLRLGRLHDAKTARKRLLAAKGLGFDNISADIMLGIPEQTEESLTQTVEALAGLPITHISAYMLIIEPNTPFGENPPRDAAGDDKIAELYALCGELCEKNGFTQYEISNFAKNGDGFQCRHNLKYWRCEEYLGIGAAAHSFYDNVRFAVPRDTRRFISEECQPTDVTDDCPADYDERVMLGLRLSEGITKELYEPLLPALRLVPDNYYRLFGGRLSLTREGFAVYNYIVSLLLAHIK